MRNSYTFIRHGQTFWNKNGVMHGQYDIPLTNKGHEQAKNVSRELRKTHFDVCYCSPLSRARSTAAHIVGWRESVDIVIDDRLMELSKGTLEGRHLNSEQMLKSESQEVLKRFKIESKSSFFSRVKAFIDEVEATHEGKSILIVCHSGTVKMLMFCFDYPSEPLNKAYYSIHIKNCKIYHPKNNGRNIDMKVGFFPMVADILHSGHVLALEEARKHCDYLIVGLHCKPSYKDPQQSIYERFMQLRAVKWVDEVIPYENSERDADMFTSLAYDVYFLGDDHKGEEWQAKDHIESAEKQVVYLNRNHNYSSTRVKNDSRKS